MPGLIGRKVAMTQIYDEAGNIIPITILEVGPCPVIQVKTKESDGYEALKMCYQKSKKNLNKAKEGNFKKANIEPHKYIKEFRCNADSYKAGDVLTVNIFENTSYLDITGITKGKGFQGVVKRWNFHGGRKTHGSHHHREPGSVGQCQWPGRIIKGKKMPGRMGGKRKTVQNMKIIEIDNEKNVILVKGAIPGPNNGILYIKEAVKKAVVSK